MRKGKILFLATERYPATTGNGVSMGQYSWLQAFNALGMEVVVAPVFLSYPQLGVKRTERQGFSRLGFRCCLELEEGLPHLLPRLRMVQQAVWPTRAGAFPGLACLRQHLRELLERENPDLLVVFGWASVTLANPLSRCFPSVAIVVDLPAGNLESRWAGLAQLPAGRRWREVLRLTSGRRLWRWGITDLRPFRMVVEHAAHHAKLLRELGLPDVRYVPHCMPEPHNAADIGIEPPEDAEIRVLMLGSLKGATSRLGFEFLLNPLLPELRAGAGSIQKPFRIRIVGHGEMLSALRSRLEQQPEIEFGGFAQDVAAEYRNAHVMLVVIPTEVGFRTRIAEAFGYGKCVVAHSANRAGMPELQDGVNCLHTEDGPGLAERLVSAMNDGALRRRLAAGARNTFESSYSPAAMVGAVRTAVGTVLGEGYIR